VNIGAGEEFTIREFATRICESIGYPAERIQYDTTRYVGAKSKSLAIDKLKSLLPDYEPIALEEGLRRTIAWFYESGAYILAL
jgi:GDP-L-fucose synthase